jgi:hypothetical protein
MSSEVKEQSNSQLITAVEEAKKKVTSSLSPSIDEHVSSDAFDYKKDGLDFLEVRF